MSTPPPAIHDVRSPENESGLVFLAKSGDRDAFGRLVLLHQDRVFNAVARFCGDRDRALDIAQKAFVNAWRSIARFEEKARFGTWLYRIAINLAISDARSRRGEARSLAAIGDGRDDGADYDPPDPGAGPSAGAESRETQALVQAAIRSLDEDHRAIIVLCDIEGRSYDEAAETLEVPKGTVRSRLHRARMELKAKLERVLRGPDPATGA